MTPSKEEVEEALKCPCNCSDASCDCKRVLVSALRQVLAELVEAKEAAYAQGVENTEAMASKRIAELEQNQRILKTVDAVDPSATQYVDAVLKAVDRAENAEAELERRTKSEAGWINTVDSLRARLKTLEEENARMRPVVEAAKECRDEGVFQHPWDCASIVNLKVPSKCDCGVDAMFVALKQEAE